MPKTVDRMKAKIAEERAKAGEPVPRRCCKGYLGVHTANCPRKGLNKQAGQVVGK